MQKYRFLVKFKIIAGHAFIYIKLKSIVINWHWYYFPVVFTRYDESMPNCVKQIQTNTNYYFMAYFYNPTVRDFHVVLI